MNIINPILIWEIGDSSYWVLSTEVGHLRDDLIVIYLLEMHQ